MIKRSDRLQFILTLISALFSLLAVLFLLPREISLSFSQEEVKSSYYLILLTLLPLCSTYLVALKDLSRSISLSILLLIEGYALLVVLSALGIPINIEGIILLLLSFLFLFIALAIKDEKSKVKINLKWVVDDKKKKEAQRIGFILFLTLFLEGVISAFLLFFSLLSIGFPIVLWMVTIVVTTMILLKRSF